MREFKAVEIRRIRFDIVKAILKEDEILSMQILKYLL